VEKKDKVCRLIFQKFPSTFVGNLSKFRLAVRTLFIRLGNALDFSKFFNNQMNPKSNNAAPSLRRYRSAPDTALTGWRVAAS
jgi:hypothetical protein